MKALVILNTILEDEEYEDMECLACGFTRSYYEKAIAELESNIPKYKQCSFDEWWSFIGSSFSKERKMNGAEIESLEDDEEFANRIAKKAWEYAMFLRMQALK